MIKTLKQIGLIALLPIIFWAVGNALNEFLPWDLLTYFFVVVYHLINLFGWLYDMDTLWYLASLSWFLLGLYWVFLMSIKIIKFFNK